MPECQSLPESIPCVSPEDAVFLMEAGRKPLLGSAPDTCVADNGEKEEPPFIAVMQEMIGTAVWKAEQQAFHRMFPVWQRQPWLFNALNAEVLRIAELPESACKPGFEILLEAKAAVESALSAIGITVETQHDVQKPEEHHNKLC